MIPRGWNESNIGNLAGKRFLITGATSGIGKEAARQLVRAGADVTITARSAEKGEATIADLGQGRLSYGILDLADLESIKKFASSITHDFDVLILNAGVMATPLMKTKDGFELQMGTNHLGHFALAGLLRKQIRDRVISVSSQAHRFGNFGDNSVGAIRARALAQGQYKPWAAYGASKLANLLFIHELHRRSQSNNWNLTSVAVHPGWSATHLQSVGPEMRGAHFEERVTSGMNSLFAQSAARGALPTLCGATLPGLASSSYIGPDGLFEMRGYPKMTRGIASSYDQTLASNLWSVSEELTGVRWL
jgi:NAD(P)-dependent dehydrogenase (short-subunit alcohol dehydrogenase family)